MANGDHVYVRHLSHLDHQNYEDEQDAFEEHARKIGAPTEVQRLVQLKERDLWSDSKETDIDRQRDAITRLEENRHLIAVPSILRNHDAHTQRERDTLAKMVNDRAQVIGTTVETYAQRRLEDFYLIHNLFVDKKMQTLMFDWNAFDDLTDPDVDKLHDTYKAAIEPCSDANLRRLAVQDFFYSYYTLCADNITNFFGHPICFLTYYQVRLGNMAKYFKYLLEHTDMAKIPAESRNDPDAIERLNIVQKNNTALDAEGKAPSNLTASDIKELGKEGQFGKVEREASGVDAIKDFLKNSRSKGG